jgi:hypothetical protein
MRRLGDAVRRSASSRRTLAEQQSVRVRGLRWVPYQEGLGMRIKGQADIDIFISDTGYICLKQKDAVDGERMIEFAPAYGTKVAEAIGALREFAQQKFEKAEFIDD